MEEDSRVVDEAGVDSRQKELGCMGQNRQFRRRIWARVNQWVEVQRSNWAAQIELLAVSRISITGKKYILPIRGR